MKNRRKKVLIFGLGIVLPLLLSSLYYMLRGNSALMDSWVGNILRPVAQGLGLFWSLTPLSVAEVITIAAVIAVPYWILRGVYLWWREKRIRPFVRCALPVIVGGLWVFALLNWMWNVTYYATGFGEKSGLNTSPYSVEELVETTVYYAQMAAEYSTVPDRTIDLHFTIDQRDCFQRAISVYDNLEVEYPFLEMTSVAAKPLIFSRTQSMLGFTGIYFPFTGEANVNVDAPWCLIPCTIAHEMAHQRMVASEDEANFLGITACITSDDPVFQYSGYLYGLIQLSNALYSVSPETWQTIWATYATQELYTDWNDNYLYWDSLESHLEDAATEVYDNFLKGNDQELGMQSYGACVDLLVAYYHQS